MSEMNQIVGSTGGLQRVNVVLWICAALVLLATWPAGGVQAKVDVPFVGNMIPCNNQYIGDHRGLVGPIRGKDGEKGYKTYPTDLNSIPTLQGQTFLVYCLVKNDKHGGPSQAALFTPGLNKPGVWIGACTLDPGGNVFSAEADKILAVAEVGAVINQFTSFKWKNYTNISRADSVKLVKPGDETAANYIGYEYEYKVAGDELTIFKTMGKYVADARPDGGLTAYYVNKEKTMSKNAPIKAPQKFEGLNFSGTQLTLGNGSPGFGRQSLELALAMAPGRLPSFTLLSDALYGTGAASDPFVGLAVTIRPGDTLTIGVTDPGFASVTGSAATSAYGGWKIGAMTSYSVTFEATVSAVLLPGDMIDGFNVDASIIGDSALPWIYAGTDALAHSAGYAVSD